MLEGSRKDYPEEKTVPDMKSLMYEPPSLIDLGTIEELTQGLPLLQGVDLVLFYGGRGFANES